MVQLQIMRCKGTVIFLLLSLGGFLALATRDVAVHRINNDAMLSGSEESRSKERSTFVGVAAKKWLGGRKTALKEDVNGAAVNTGNVDASASVSLGSVIAKDHSATKVVPMPPINLKSTGAANSPRAAPHHASSASYESEQVAFHGSEYDHLSRATAYMFSMMKKDYHNKRHGKPPINNKAQLEHANAKP